MIVLKSCKMQFKLKIINSEIFDRASDSYAKEVQDSIDFTGIEHDTFVKAKINLLRMKSNSLNLKLNSSVLDVGCGNGLMHGELARLGFKVTGIDVSSKSLERAKLMNPQCSYYHFDGTNIPFGSDEFDFAVSTCVYHHIQDIGQRKRLASETLRVLRNGGKFALIEHNPLNLLTQIAVSRCEFDRDACLLRRSNSKNLLIDSGFHGVRGDYFMFIPHSSLLSRRIESWLAKLPIGAQYMVYGEKRS